MAIKDKRKVRVPRSPIKWMGGKGKMVKKILPLFPPHTIYVEPFGGGGSLIFAKEPSLIEVYNDVDTGLVNFFRVLRDFHKFAEFFYLVSLTPYAREEYNFCRATWENCDDEVEKAYRWFVVARMSFGGHFGRSWGRVITKHTENMPETVSTWLSILELLPLIHYRFMTVQVENMDFRDVMQAYDTSDTLQYVDPPYIPETRRSGGYKYELTEKDHKELVELLLSLSSKIILSGYNHPIYKPLEDNGWQRIDFNVACHVVGRTKQTGLLGTGTISNLQKRVESVWLSPNCYLEKRG